MKMAAHKEARFFVRSQRSSYQLSVVSYQLLACGWLGTAAMKFPFAQPP
jgi:hypothetical protein